MGGDLRQIGSDFDARQSVTFRKSAFAYAVQAVGQDDFRQIFAAVKRLFTDGLDSAQHLEGQIRLADGIGHELSAEIEDALPRLECAALLRPIQRAVEERLPGLQSRGQGDTFQICARKGDFGTGKVLRSVEHDAFEGGEIFGLSVVGLRYNRHAARSENNFPQIWTMNDSIFLEFEEGVGQHELFHGAILHTGVFYALDPFGKSHCAFDDSRIVNQRRRAAVDDRRILHVTIGVRPVDFHPTDIRRAEKKRIDEGSRVLVRGIEDGGSEIDFAERLTADKSGGAEPRNVFHVENFYSVIGREGIVSDFLDGSAGGKFRLVLLAEMREQFFSVRRI